MASEFGSLYGVTIDWLYRIKLDTHTFESVIYNTFGNGDWYGAAGLHEGMILNAALFSSSSDANNNTNPLPPLWTNTQSGQQTIYVRIENETTGEYVIHPVIITVNNTPQLTQPENLMQCSDDEVNMFDLQLVEDELLQNITLLKVLWSATMNFQNTPTLEQTHSQYYLKWMFRKKLFMLG